MQGDAAHFVIRVPLIGKFSSGKSTLLNAVLGERVLTTSIDPQTALPAEITHAAGPARFVACQSGGREQPLTAEQVRNNDLQALGADAWVRISHPAAALARWPHLCLVDLPGLDSSIESHSRAIDGYVHRSLAYCAIVSAEEGTLHESMQKALRDDLRLMPDLPVIAVITKSDKRPPEDLQAIAAKVTEEITAALGRPPQATVCASRRQAQDFMAALDALERQAEAIFNHRIGQRLQTLLAQAEKRLDTLANRDDLDSEKIAAEHARLQSELTAFERAVQQRTQQLQGDLPYIENTILQGVQSALQSRIDSHISTVLGGGNVKNDIQHTVRAALNQGVQQDFAPELKHYLKNLEAALPDDLPPIDIAPPETGDMAKLPSGLTGVFAGLTALLTQLVPKLAGPIGIIISAAIPVLGLIFGGPSDADRARQREERRDAARDGLESTYASVIDQIRPKLAALLQEQVQTAQSQIEQGARQQRDQQAATLRELERRLAQGQEQFAAAQEETRADLARLRQWQAEAARIASAESAEPAA